MSAIPDEIYQTIDRKLRIRRKMKQRAEARLERARMKAGINGQGSGPGGKHGNTSDRTGRAAVAIVTAENQLKKTMKWLSVFETVDRIYPDTSEEGAAARMIYGRGMSQQDVCRVTGCTRSTIRRRIDRYIYRCALLAAAEGLINKRELSRSEPDQ